MKSDTLISNSANTSSSDTAKSKGPDFGKGRFSGEMERIYLGLIARFELPADKAEKIARQAASDAGEILANVSASFKVSKVSKDGKVSITDAAKAKGVTVTNALMIARALQWIDDCPQNGVSFGFTKWKLSAPLQAYVDEMTVKKTEQAAS
jgi:hypothetical protein